LPIEFEYESDGGYSTNGMQVGGAEIENQFYDAEDIRSSNPRKALEMYSDIVFRTGTDGSDVTWYVSPLSGVSLLQAV
jgi:hypothetical protein